MPRIPRLDHKPRLSSILPEAFFSSLVGTYAQDRQPTLERLLIAPARMLANKRFIIAGSQYPQRFPWTGNIFFVHHLPAAEHSAFYSSTRLTLNITRRAMADMGYCPSGRMFEAAACGTPVLSDVWQGIEEFYEPQREILLARGTHEVVGALSLSDAELTRISRAARERTLDVHTSDCRAGRLEELLHTRAFDAKQRRVHEVTGQEAQ